MVQPARACADRRWVFRVEREGRDIGRHRIDLRPSAEGFEVGIDIDLALRFAFVTLYRYTHENREVWKEGRLQSFASRTDDNGRQYRVICTRDAWGLAIESSEGDFRAPPDSVATTYWHLAFTRTGNWIDSMTGHLRRVSFRPRAPTGALPPSCSGSPRALQVEGDLALELVYAADRLVSLSFSLGGARFVYVPLEIPAAVPELVM